MSAPDLPSPPLPESTPGPAVAAPTPERPWEASTLRLHKSDISLLQMADATLAQHACLILYSGEQAGQRFALDAPVMTLGRSPDNAICLDHPGISRIHAELTVHGTQVLLRDLSSSNGTHVNGRRLQAPTRLHDGDLLRLGKVALKYYGPQSLDALLHDRIYRLATVDEGTGVFTRRHLLETLERELRRARRSLRPLSLLCMDLDNFKNVNDLYGHAAGDAVLRGTAELVQAQVRGGDLLGRIGGEEFAVVLPETEAAAALELAERMRQSLAAHVHPLRLLDGDGARTVMHRQTASFGVARLDDHMPDARALLDAADRQLYAAKRGGRNCVSA